ncbi:chymotrypsin-2 [Rhagoletis pomonella]|uniref:chymotrypsin-2 n=1 Tax=Rhagoletis pomonella TaxID=28610 RepID=UPI001780287A|nr:chymotrypsin-2 [Rhagoletis pomonella]
MAVTRIIALATILAISHVCGTIAAPQGRILEGENAAAGEFPWVASVRVDNAHVAVGSIISKYHILTSAQGVSELGSTPISSSRVSVRVGSINQFAGGRIVSAGNILIHPSFGNFLHNIAIITLEVPLSFTDRIASIAWDKSELSETLADGINVILAGWGLQLSGASPYRLQKTTLSVLSSHECEYKAGYGYESALCLNHGVNQGIGRGDEGAGVVFNHTLVGVASFFFGAGGTEFPDVSCRTAYYSDWIVSNVDPALAYLK